MVGPRQRRILAALATGPHSLAAIQALDPDHPELVTASLRGLQRAGLVVVERASSRRTAGATVALVEAAVAATRCGSNQRPVGAELAALGERLR
jgi:hypothetical protein